VNGTGTHTVTCWTWNTALDVSGQPAMAAASLSVKIDETPPSVQLEPQDPSDPRKLIVDTGDAQSGVAGGQIQMRPRGGGSWQNLATSLAGGHLLAHFDDAGQSGAYDFQATSCDQVGNCASTTQTLTLPVRTASVSNVSFQNIVDPLQPRKIRERVLVGARMVTVKRHGRLAQVKRGGHWKNVTVIKLRVRCTRTRIKVSRHRWKEKTRCLAPRVKLSTTDRVGYGTAVAVHGLLTTGAGVPIAGAPVEVLTAPSNGLQQFERAASVTTDGSGGWTATLPKGPSRLVQASYNGTNTILPATGQAQLTVPAKVQIKITPRSASWGGTVRITGRVLGGYVPSSPRSAQMLRLDIGLDGLHKIQGIPNISPGGTFSTTYTFTSGEGTVRFWFTVTTLREPYYPFAQASSRRVTVLVGAPAARRRRRRAPRPAGARRARR
jgi:hypothetical protein